MFSLDSETAILGQYQGPSASFEYYVLWFVVGGDLSFLFKTECIIQLPGLCLKSVLLELRPTKGARISLVFV